MALYNDCDQCMRDYPRQTRQALGCGYEPRIDHAQPWQPEAWKGPSPTTCPGYTTTLPEVREGIEARHYLDKGSLNLLVKDELHDGLREAIALVEGADGEVTRWAIDNPPTK